MIHASMATIKGREDQMNRAYGSLLAQASIDTIAVYDSPHEGREDDARKFLGEPESGYMLTVDDDLIYPPDFASYMVASLERLRSIHGPCAVSLMGRVIKGQCSSYYNDRVNAFKYDWRDHDEATHRIHIPGTGVFAYHTDDVRFTMDDFPQQNMADIMVGVKCNALGIPLFRVSPPRPKWIKAQDVPDSIWDRDHMNDNVHTDIINKIKWK
jgi:hypothetical protein